jgi:hypothetical protein
MQLDLDDTNFRSTVAEWLRGLDDPVIVDLNAVFEQSPGVYPTTLVELWRVELEHRRLQPLPANRDSSATTSDDRLPVGHPVDADWRFTPESAADLVELALDGIEPEAPVAHIGAPSTFLRCVLSRSQRQHILVDRNTAVIDALISHGIGSPHLIVGADLEAIERLHFGAGAAIVDPPWYLGDTLLFLAVASSVCRPNATIVLCQPASATRPGVNEERVTLLDRVSQLGLEFHTLRSGAVRYVMPHFEAVSLRAAMNGAAIPVTWRRGDVLLFDRMSGSYPISLPRPRDAKWQEVKFGPVRIKLAEEPTGPELGALVPGDVLTTVSRRDPIRLRIGLWTSGNRVFTVANPTLLGRLIALCETDLMNGTFTLQCTLCRADNLQIDRDVATRMYNILSIELAEHNGRGGSDNG